MAFDARVALLSLCLAAAALPARASLVISKAADGDVSCGSGECHATAAVANLSVATLKQMLKAGDLKIDTGADAQDIEIDQAFNWSKPHRLTLDAFRSIVFTQAVTSQGTGGVTLVTNEGDAGGDYTFTGKGKLAFWDLSSSLVVNGAIYTLVGDIATLASDIAANPSGNFALARFYDASADETYSNAPVTTHFVGLFDGLGHTIDNLSILNTTKNRVNLALFADSGGVIRDVRLDGVKVTSHGKAVAFAGLVATNSGTLRYVSVDGTITGKANQNGIGAVVGVNNGAIWSAQSSGSVTGGVRAMVGGLVGINNGAISDSSSSSTVENSWAGGLVGMNQGGITRSFATGTVTVGDASNHQGSKVAGGLVGSNSGGTVDESYATGAVTGGNGSTGASSRWYVIAGGLVGENGGTVQDSYARGAVTVGFENTQAGGLTGTSWIALRSYSTGAVSGQGDVGGACGSANQFSTFTDIYWDLTTSGVSDPSRGVGDITNEPGITGLTDAQLKSALPSGFSGSVWAESAGVNNGYPYLIAAPPPQ